MDRAFQRADGPFDNFEESLIAFAWANYALRLDVELGGCCPMPKAAPVADATTIGEDMYVDPALEAAAVHRWCPF